MTYRTPDPRDDEVPTRLAFLWARVAVSSDRFELSFGDWQPVIALGIFVIGVASMVGWNHASLHLVRLVAPLLVVGGATYRRALVVTRTSASFERRVFGICWRRLSLGCHVSIFGGLGYPCELCAIPSDPGLRVPLYEHRRAVLAEWEDDEPRKDRDGIRLAAFATRQVARLHGPPRGE